MEKRYLEGNARVAGYGTLKVVFDDIKNYEERKNNNGEIIHFEFDDKDSHYSYTKVGKLYVEDNDLAPELSEFRTIGRRTALKHDLLTDEKRIEVKPQQNQQSYVQMAIDDLEEDEDEDEEEDDEEEDKDEEDEEEDEIDENLNNNKAENGLEKYEDIYGKYKVAFAYRSGVSLYSILEGNIDERDFDNPIDAQKYANKRYWDEIVPLVIKIEKDVIYYYDWEENKMKIFAYYVPEKGAWIYTDYSRGNRTIYLK